MLTKRPLPSSIAPPRLGARSTIATLTVSAMSLLVKTVAEAPGQEAAFAAVADAANTFIGHRLFTIMAFDAQAMQVRRLYSSNPAAYPRGGSKAKRDSPWGRRVLQEGRPFIGRDAADIRANFDDHEIILGLGLASVLNVPIRVCGRTIGTMNLLHQAQYYQAADLESGSLLASQLAGPVNCAIAAATLGRT
jgi:GAF domain-containing protein